MKDGYAKQPRIDKDDFYDHRGAGGVANSNFRPTPGKSGGKSSFLWKNTSNRNLKKQTVVFRR